MKRILYGTAIVLVVVVLVACSGIQQRLPWVKSPTPTMTSIPATPTPTPESQLTVCLGEEPPSLYIYSGQQNRAMWNVLDAIYDGPLDQRAGLFQPVILEKVPSYEDGDLTKLAVPVKERDLVIDSEGQVRSLEQGVKIFPAGCVSSDCALIWDGSTPIEMEQITAVYKLRSGIVWSDGEPLTSDDTIFSYNIAKDPATQGFNGNIDVTESYEKVDDRTVRWTGIPGYSSTLVGGMYWIPLPKHILGNIPVAQLRENDQAARMPIGWGPYKIEEWVPGDHISLVRNGNYFRKNEGLPLLDRLVYRIIPPGSTPDVFKAGTCDLFARTDQFQDLPEVVKDSVADGSIKEYKTNGPEILQLLFGIKPASYDDGINLAIDRPDLLGDNRVRLALSACIDTEKINDQVFGGMGTPASLSDLIGNQSETDNGGIPAYDPVQARQTLEDLGWRQSGIDPKEPRVAENVNRVPAGTKLVLTLKVPDDRDSVEVAALIQQSLQECGVEIVPEKTAFDELYAPGPNGEVFGRSFELALITWQYSLVPACGLVTTAQVPNPSNYWVGTNVTGYSDPDYDDLCTEILHSQPGDGNYEDALQKAVTLYSSEIPALPLIKIPYVILARADLCNLSFDPGARSDFTRIEEMGFGSMCNP